MPALTRQISDEDKQDILNQQRRDGVLRCFVDDHPIEDETTVEFHHIKPYSDDGPTEAANVGAVCKEHHRRIRTLSLSEFRDQLALERFFEHPEQRRLDDLLAFKLPSGSWGRKIVTEQRDRKIILNFYDQAPQTLPVFTCAA